MKTQTIIALPVLQLSFARAMADVPNTKGFRLLGIVKDKGFAIPLCVEVDANGCHYLADQNHSHRSTSVFSGWVKDEAAR